MNMIQIGLAFQILGIVLVMFFAGMLLERGMVGRLSDRLYGFLVSASNSLQRIFPPPSRMQWEGALFYLLFSVIALYTPLVLILVGWLIKIPWAIYVGVAAVLGFLVPAFRLILYSQHRLSTSKKVAEDLLILLLTIPLLFFTGTVIALQALTAWLATRDRLKKLLIVFGSIMLLAGLILEFISTL